MKKNPIETILGLFVLIFAAVFLFFALADVRISGIKVGTVLETRLNNETYTADVVLNIDSKVKLPIDTVAAIADAGIMGDKYVRLEPGKSRAFLVQGDEIANTKNYKSLEDNVSEFIFLSTK